MSDKLTLPHNELVVGMTGSGKTHYLIHHLEKIIKGNCSLEKIYIICPTIEYNRTFQEYVGCHQDSVNAELREIIGVCKTNRGSDLALKTLIVLDDCAHGTDVKGRTSEIVELAYTARHLGIGVIVLTQQLTSVAKPFRENTTRLVTFYNKSKKDCSTLFDDYLGSLGKEERNGILNKLKTNRFSYLTINLKYPYEHDIVLQ